MLTCQLRNEIINCYDGTRNKEELKQLSNDNLLKCSICGNTYEYCHGKVIPPYFRHKNKETCSLLYSEPETKEHILGKKALYKWLLNQPEITEVKLEPWIPETKQRPDISFKYKGRQCVVEFQCSPISTQYYERHDLYRAANIHDFWICGVTKYLDTYHKGRGVKRISIMERESNFHYYNYLTNDFYIIETQIKEKYFKYILEHKFGYLMENPSDFSNSNRYMCIKDTSKSFETEYYYPSGRRSNKYPYPLTRYHFIKNQSIAKCKPLPQLKIEEVFRFE